PGPVERRHETAAGCPGSREKVLRQRVRRLRIVFVYKFYCTGYVRRENGRRHLGRAVYQISNAMKLNRRSLLKLLGILPLAAVARTFGDAPKPARSPARSDVWVNHYKSRGTLMVMVGRSK